MVLQAASVFLFSVFREEKRKDVCRSEESCVSFMIDLLR